MVLLYVVAVVATLHIFDWCRHAFVTKPELTLEERKRQRKFGREVLRHPWEICLLKPIVEELDSIWLTSLIMMLWGFEPWYLLEAAILVQAALFANSHGWATLYQRLVLHAPFSVAQGTVYVMIVEYYRTPTSAVGAVFLLIGHHALCNTLEHLRIVRYLAARFPKHNAT